MTFCLIKDTQELIQFREAFPKGYPILLPNDTGIGLTGELAQEAREAKLTSHEECTAWLERIKRASVCVLEGDDEIVQFCRTFPNGYLISSQGRGFGFIGHYANVVTLMQVYSGKEWLGLYTEIKRLI